MTGAAGAAAPRIRVWRSPGFETNAVKWAMKISLSLGILLFGFSPMISIATKNGKIGFYIGLVGFTVIKIVMLSTLVVNHIARRRLLKEQDNSERAPLVNTAT